LRSTFIIIVEYRIVTRVVPLVSWNDTTYVGYMDR